MDLTELEQREDMLQENYLRNLSGMPYDSGCDPQKDTRGKLPESFTTPWSELAMTRTCTCIYHFLVMSWYIFLNYYISQKGGRDQQKSKIFLNGGQWKYLTLLNLAIFYGVACMEDVLKRIKGEKDIKFMTAFRDLLFTTLAFPISTFVFLSFWILFLYDRELVYPKALDGIFPVWLNHAMDIRYQPKYVLLIECPSPRHSQGDSKEHPLPDERVSTEKPHHASGCFGSLLAATPRQLWSPILTWRRGLPTGFPPAPSPFPGLCIFPAAEQSLVPNWKFDFLVPLTGPTIPPQGRSGMCWGEGGVGGREEALGGLPLESVADTKCFETTTPKSTNYLCSGKSSASNCGSCRTAGFDFLRGCRLLDGDTP
ncbi:hypothetical protein GH733_016710 [Mirounga leonina]|nr:hypothetical protein GH733_016710 [Mirounga leonina]